jgi:F-type H+-transporting ATPase subunit delta
MFSLASRQLFTRSLSSSVVRTSSTLRVSVRGFAVETGDDLTFDFKSPFLNLLNSSRVKQVTLPGASGIFAILPGHVPTVAELRPGLVTIINKDESSSRFFVSGGFAYFTPENKLSVSSPEAFPLEQLDINAARQGLDSWTLKLGSATSEDEKTKASIAVEVHQAIINAIEKDI